MNSRVNIMRVLVISLLIFLVACTSQSGKIKINTKTLNVTEISEFDSATYTLLKVDRSETKMQYRLSVKNGKWFMEARILPETWKNVSCDVGCEYRKSLKAEIDLYKSLLSKQISGNLQVACIQNIAQAFCRVIKHDDHTRAMYMMVALVTKQPVLMGLKRLPE